MSSKRVIVTKDTSRVNNKASAIDAMATIAVRKKRLSVGVHVTNHIASIAWQKW